MPAEETSLVRLLELLGEIKTGHEFISWVSEDLHKILAHRACICGLGRIQRTGVSPIKILTSNFPVAYLQALKQPDGLYDSAAIKSWLESGEVQLLDVGNTAGAGLDSVWLEHFKASGLQNIAAHGVYDFSRHHASFFSFYQIPEPLGERHRRLLNILVPHMHAALLRILHEQETDTASRRSARALTSRELEVLMWVCEGKTSTEIATILGVAHGTVRNQIQSILVKLCVNTRAQAAAKAIKKGLVIPQQPDSVFGKKPG